MRVQENPTEGPQDVIILQVTGETPDGYDMECATQTMKSRDMSQPEFAKRSQSRVSKTNNKRNVLMPQQSRTQSQASRKTHIGTSETPMMYQNVDDYKEKQANKQEPTGSQSLVVLQ